MSGLETTYPNVKLLLTFKKNDFLLLNREKRVKFERMGTSHFVSYPLMMVRSEH